MRRGYAAIGGHRRQSWMALAGAALAVAAGLAAAPRLDGVAGLTVTLGPALGAAGAAGFFVVNNRGGDAPTPEPDPPGIAETGPGPTAPEPEPSRPAESTPEPKPEPVVTPPDTTPKSVGSTGAPVVRAKRLHRITVMLVNDSPYPERFKPEWMAD